MDKPQQQREQNISKEQTELHPMTKEDASRIQSTADRIGTNQDFKARAQSAADQNAQQDIQ